MKQHGMIGAFLAMRPGESMVYYTGTVGWNQGVSFDSLNVWFDDAQKSGNWDFMQRKVGPAGNEGVSVYEYIIRRRHKPYVKMNIAKHSRFRTLSE
jgi:hypothetical protein